MKGGQRKPDSTINAFAHSREAPAPARRTIEPPLMLEGAAGTPREGQSLPTSLPKPNPALVNDKAKQDEMKAYLNGLGCKFKHGAPNPLKKEELLVQALSEYLKIFGCLPTQPALASQQLNSLRVAINSVYGGFTGVHQAYFEGKIPVASGLSATESPQMQASGIRAPRFSSLDKSALHNQEKAGQMRKYLTDELGCAITVGTPNPLKAHRPLAARAIIKYHEVFGTLPSDHIMVQQGLTVLQKAIRKHYTSLGGMREAFQSGQMHSDAALPIENNTVSHTRASARQQPEEYERKKDEMVNYLGSIGYVKGKSQILYNRGVLSAAILKYLELFHALPTFDAVKGPGMVCIVRPISSVFGGFRVMREKFKDAEAAHLRKISEKSGGSADAIPPVQSRLVPRGPPQPFLERKAARRASSPPGISGASAQSSGRAIPQANKTPGTAGMVSLTAYCPPAESGLIKSFLDGFSRERMRRTGLYKGMFALVKCGLEIPFVVKPEESRIYFREEHIPALLFAAKMRIASPRIKEEEILTLERESKGLNKNSPYSLQLKMWVAKEIYQELGGTHESEKSLRHSIDALVHVHQAFFNSTSHLFTTVRDLEHAIRTSSSLSG